MITIYKKTSKNKTFVLTNDLYFNKYTSEKLDERAESIISKIDGSNMNSKYSIESRFDGTTLNIDCLSTGCKTALNIMYFPEKIFSVSECGENALELIYSFHEGQIYCDYPMIAFNMTEAKVIDGNKEVVFDDYEKLKVWWCDEK